MASQKQWKVIIILVVLQISLLRGSSDYVPVTTDASVLAYERKTLPDSQIPQPDVHKLHIYSNIKYRYATTVVTSTVVNPADVAQTINFTVVLPESAFITGFTVLTDDKTYKSLVVKKAYKKQDAQADEDEVPAVHFQNCATRNPKQFTVYFNAEPHKKADFKLTYEQMLTRSLGEYHHVININSGQMIPDLSVIVKITETAEIVKLQVQEINENNSENDETANGLAIIERPGATVATIYWIPTPEQQKQIAEDGVNGQLIVKYDVDRESKHQQILVEEGYFVHFFAPEPIPPLRKHVVFVLDYSGSVSEYKREQIRTAMKTALIDLKPSDYFSLVLFSEKAAAWYPFVSKFTDQLYKVQSVNNDLRSSVAKHEHDEKNGDKNEDDYDYETEDDMSNGVLPASRGNKELAIEFLESFVHYGTTNIMDGLRKGINVTQIGKSLFQNETSRPEPLIVFLTDGQPNAEIFDTNEIIKEVKKLNTDRIPIFCIGFGFNDDSNFLSKLSLNNNAFARNIHVDAESYPYPVEQLITFYKEISSPLLTNIEFNYNPDEVNNAFTSRVHFPVYFNGSEIVVVGRFYKTDLIIAGEVLASSTGDLKKIWAYLTLQQLMDNITIQEGKECNDTKMKAVDLALQYSFETPLTSLIVVKLDSASATNTEKIHLSGNSSSGTLQTKSNDTLLISFNKSSPVTSVHHVHLPGLV